MDRIADEVRCAAVSELEREVRRLRAEAEIAVKFIVTLIALLGLTLICAGRLYAERDFKAHVAAYEIAARCVNECDCSRIGPEPDR